MVKGKHCDTFSVRLCGELADGLNEVVMIKGGSKSYHIRRAIQIYVQENKDTIKSMMEERDNHLKRAGELEQSIRKAQEELFKSQTERLKKKDFLEKWEQIKPEIIKRMKLEPLASLINHKSFLNHYSKLLDVSPQELIIFLKSEFSS